MKFKELFYTDNVDYKVAEALDELVDAAKSCDEYHDWTMTSCAAMDRLKAAVKDLIRIVNKE